MFEFDWKKNKTVYRNLLGIKGISHTTAKKLCALLGISNNTLYSQLASHKVDLLNLLLNLYNKKTNFLTLNSLSDLVETTLGNSRYNLSLPPLSQKEIINDLSPTPPLNPVGLSWIDGFPLLHKRDRRSWGEKNHQSDGKRDGKPSRGKPTGIIPQSMKREKQWVEEGNMMHTPIQNSLNLLRKENILSLINLNTYRGRRYKFGYPVKGQRTRSNARTARKLNRIKYT